MDYEVEAIRSGERPKKTWTEDVEKDCQIQQLHKKDAMDCSKWYNTHKYRECGELMFFLVPANPGHPGVPFNSIA